MRSRFALHRRDKQSRRSGTPSVEMALVLPIFHARSGHHRVWPSVHGGAAFRDAAREGARTAIMTGSTNTAVTTDAQSFIVSTTKCVTADVTVTITITEATGNAPAGNNLANAHKRDLCRVKSYRAFREGQLPAGDIPQNENTFRRVCDASRIIDGASHLAQITAGDQLSHDTDRDLGDALGTDLDTQRGMYLSQTVLGYAFASQIVEDHLDLSFAPDHAQVA